MAGAPIEKKRKNLGKLAIYRFECFQEALASSAVDARYGRIQPL